MGLVAAIDIGSNAIRLAIGSSVPQETLREVRSYRKALRLGADVFVDGRVSIEKIDLMIETLKEFAEILSGCGEVKVRAVATSALREASNREEVVRAVYQASGIPLDVISALEEARLISVGITSAVGLQNTSAIHFDMGGGSFEVSHLKDGAIARSTSLPLGAVRLMQRCRSQSLSMAQLANAIDPEIRSGLNEFLDLVTHQHISVFVGTGGTFKCLRDLKKSLLNTGDQGSLSSAEFRELEVQLHSISDEQKRKQLSIKPDHADVIGPACVVFRSVFDFFDIASIQIPRVGLKEGVLLDLAFALHASKNDGSE